MGLISYSYPNPLPPLYRGEKLIYNPEILGFPSNRIGNIKWREITIRFSNFKS